MSEPWFDDATRAYLVQYLGGGSIFALGLGLAFRHGELSLKTRAGRRWTGILVGGYLFYATIHGVLQFELLQ